TPLKFLRLLLLGASSCLEEPNKSKEALHELRASLCTHLTNGMILPLQALLLRSREELKKEQLLEVCPSHRKTSGFERPRAPVLQILWGVVTQTHIDYAERIWEEFTQSIHTFIDDKRNLAQHTSGKKKATLIVILKSVLGYLKFNAKGTNRKVFGMPIPGSDPNSLVPKPTKTVRKPKPTAHKAHPRPSVSKPVSSTQAKPKSAPAKTQGKKRKLTIEISDKPSKAITSRHGFVSKKYKLISTLKSVDESMAEDVPVKEPRVDDEEADVQRALEESMKSMYDVPRGPLPPVVIREHESGKYQPLPEVPGKGKAKVTEEKSNSEEESEKVMLGDDEGGQGEGQARPDPDCEHMDLDVADVSPQPSTEQLSEEETEKDVPGADAGGQGEGQAGPDLGNAEESQPMPSHVVHAGSDRKHMDLDVADVSPQPPPEQMDERFTAMAYPKVQENLKLTVEEQVLLEEPASSSGTLSSLQHLTKDLSFGDLFFSDKPSKADNDKATVETEAESMVSVTIQQDMYLIPPMTTLKIDLTSRPESPKRLDSHGARLYTLEQLDIPHQVSKAVNEVVIDAVDWAMQAPLRNRFRDLLEADMKEILHQRMWETDSYKSHEDHMQLYEALEKSMNRNHSEELAKDLAEARKKKKKSRESPKTPHGSPPHQPPPPPPPPGPSGASGYFGASGSSQVPPPPPSPLSTTQEGPSKGSGAPSSAKTAASAEYQAWMMTDIRLKPSISLTPVDLQMDEDMAPDEQAQSSDDEDIRSAHIPKVNLRQDWWKPLEEERHATPQPAWLIPSSDVPVQTNTWASALASDYSPRPAFEIVKVFYPDVIHLQYQMEECHKLLTDSVDDSILRHNISKPLPLGGPPGQIKEECKYDIAAMYGISHWWFQRQRLYIDRHTSEGDRSVVRTHIQILSVVRIEVFSMYGYDYMKKIVLRRADLNKHVITERDFKYLYPSNFEDLYLLNLQGHLNHLPPKDKKILTIVVNQWTRHLVIRQRVKDFQLGIESYQTQLNLTKPRWDATGFEYKHGYTIIDSLRVVMFRDRYGVQMIMRFNEIHKFGDGTLQQIDEALDYRVKEFKINRMNPGLNMRFWTRKDVDKSKAFMFAIQKH
nr:hypothetical protein [Tanacetum cinerariifolium]